MDLSKSEFLITGGTGSLGRALTKLLKTKYSPRGIRIFSRSELNQWKMKNELESLGLSENVAFINGDIRDFQSVELAMQGVDIVIHAAAMKQIGACQENPMEAIKTNIFGAQNILYAALKTNPEKVIGISSDKACNPINLYGNTKACMEKLFVHGNIYSGGRTPNFSCVRYGNVLGSSGSVIQAFKKQAEKNDGKVLITDERMTRFWTTLPKMAQFILDSLQIMGGKEIFVPRLRSSLVIELAHFLGYKRYNVCGVREGEKLHETLITQEESPHVIEINRAYIIFPENKNKLKHSNFEYRSDTNTEKLTREDINGF